MYRTVIPPFVLYGCEMWSLTLSEEHRLKVLEKRLSLEGEYFGLRQMWQQDNG
jgi:hypothetical protein